MSTLNPYIPSVETPPQKTSFQLAQEAAAQGKDPQEAVAEAVEATLEQAKGPRNGSPEIVIAAEAPIIAQIDGSFSPS